MKNDLADLLESRIGRNFLLSYRRARNELPKEMTAKELTVLAAEACLSSSPYDPEFENSEHDFPHSSHLADQEFSKLSVPGTPLDHKRQLWLTPRGIKPSPENFRFDSSRFPADTTKPSLAFWTSTDVGDFFTSWQAWLEEGPDAHPKPWNIWHLEISPGVRVAEIHSPDTWGALCEKYPHDATPGVLEPDWEAVSADWDAVHLSLRGLLTAQQVAVDCGSARTTQLLGWDAESTLWLRWRFTAVNLVAVIS
ncbi:hypothetical protein GCM10027160_04770 [Streptomyces calidiresistens]|uniref:Uncharacterized protein n=1 Tax=Streptomyces calidiresistens TaxID=1485586 RepID=A0A7W3T1B4_9ACTN|nr:hypothetical protein [Streptomyces calidiresistens]MBB0229092.1 hypothetical protein [Streptomyces calidiresistens]